MLLNDPIRSQFLICRIIIVGGWQVGMEGVKSQEDD